MVGNLDEFYKNLRWKGWKNDIRNINADQTILFNPPLWKKAKKLKKAEKTIISAEEMWFLYDNLVKEPNKKKWN